MRALYPDGVPAQRGDILVSTRPLGPSRETSVDFLRVTDKGTVLVRGVEVIEVREPAVLGLKVERP